MHHIYDEESEDGTCMTSKGYIEMQDGDKIEFLCDYYGYNGEYKDTYKLQEEVTVQGDLQVTTIALEDVKAIYGYRLTDIYNANSWTPMMVYRN